MATTAKKLTARDLLSLRRLEERCARLSDRVEPRDPLLAVELSALAYKIAAYRDRAEHPEHYDD